VLPDFGASLPTDKGHFFSQATTCNLIFEGRSQFPVPDHGKFKLSSAAFQDSGRFDQDRKSFLAAETGYAT
jgi:hypothetical protein